MLYINIKLVHLNLILFILFFKPFSSQPIRMDFCQLLPFLCAVCISWVMHVQWAFCGQSGMLFQAETNHFCSYWAHLDILKRDFYYNDTFFD